MMSSPTADAADGQGNVWNGTPFIVVQGQSHEPTLACGVCLPLIRGDDQPVPIRGIRANKDAYVLFWNSLTIMP